MKAPSARATEVVRDRGRWLARERAWRAPGVKDTKSWYETDGGVLQVKEDGAAQGGHLELRTSRERCEMDKGGLHMMKHQDVPGGHPMLRTVKMVQDGGKWPVPAGQQRCRGRTLNAKDTRRG